MRKISIFLSALVVAVMMLTACTGQSNSTMTPGTEEPSMTDTVGTPSGSEVPSGSETPATGNETATPEETATAGIPVTGGEDDAGRVTNELDFTVWNQDGEQIGEVDDMVLDLDTLSVSYVVVGTGGFLEIGEKTVLVPWDSLVLQAGTDSDAGEGENIFVLQTDQETFNNAPDTDLDSVLPDMGAPANNWDSDINNYWNNGGAASTSAPSTDETSTPAMSDATATPATSDDGTMTEGAGALQGVALASDVLDANISLSATGVEMTAEPGTSDTPAATDDTTATPAMSDASSTPVPGTDMTGTISMAVDDLIVDTNTGELQYIVVDTNFDDGEYWIPVPLNVLQWDASNETLVINTDFATLQSAPSFQDGQYPDTSADGWDVDYSDFWDNQ